MILRLLASAARVFSLILLAALGTIVLMRSSPGYFADTRELDAQYSATARSALDSQRAHEGSLPALLASELHSLATGNLGLSRQYGIPVTDLLRGHAALTARLLAESILCGWLFSLTLALLLSARRTSSGEALIAAPSALLLAVPVGALATVCLVTDFGGPLLVLASLIAVRDFKLVYRLLRRTWRAPHYLYARALGLPPWRIVLTHLLPPLSAELFALLLTSGVVALSLVVPVEVIFDLPGLGHLAWAAALNRDLPVLLAVTLPVAACVALAGALNPKTNPLTQETHNSKLKTQNS